MLINDFLRLLWTRHHRISLLQSLQLLLSQPSMDQNKPTLSLARQVWKELLAAPPGRSYQESLGAGWGPHSSCRLLSQAVAGSSTCGVNTLCKRHNEKCPGTTKEQSMASATQYQETYTGSETERQGQMGPSPVQSPGPEASTAWASLLTINKEQCRRSQKSRERRWGWRGEAGQMPWVTVIPKEKQLAFLNWPHDHRGGLCTVWQPYSQPYFPSPLVEQRGEPLIQGGTTRDSPRGMEFGNKREKF